MRRLLLSLIVFCGLIGAYAQSDNYGLHFTDGAHKVTCGRMHRLEGAELFTVEAWIKVETWEQNASILFLRTQFLS